MDNGKLEYLDEAHCCSRQYDSDGCVIDASNCKGGNSLFIVGGNGTICNKGSGGMLCDVCEDGYYLDNGVCLVCEGEWLPVLWFSLVVLFLVFVINYLAIEYKEQLNSLRLAGGDVAFLRKMIFNPGRLKVLYSFGQIIASITRATTVIWPEPFAWFAGIYTITEFDVVKVLPAGCMNPDYTFYDSVLTGTLLPLAIFFALVMGSNWLKLLSKSDAMGYGLTVAYIVLPSTSQTLAAALPCEEFPDGTAWLSADLSQQCSADGVRTTERHLWLVYIFIMMLICE